MQDTEARPPLPPFSFQTALQKVQAAQDAWNSKDPNRVIKAYTPDSQWRNRDEFLNGRQQIFYFLKRKWLKQHEYRLKKELWCFGGNRIAVRFQYEYHDDNNQWWRAYGNENWEFNENGLMRKRFASINDVAISENQRRIK